jgi:fructokinase
VRRAGGRSGLSVYGGIEAGGTKWQCAIGTGPADVRATTTIPTTTPRETIDRAVTFFERKGPVRALGIGSFGPLDGKPASPTWGYITTTPKPGWAQGLETFCYVTVGTGIGGGGMVGGSLLHGLVHPEFGHLRVPHDRPADPFPGICPYHGDCWEGLASGRAMEARWGKPAHELTDELAWDLEARYLALGLVCVICVLSPERIVIGGGVMNRAGLLQLVQREIVALMNGYLGAPPLAEGIAGFVTSPGLGARAGVLGALALAESA